MLLFAPANATTILNRYTDRENTVYSIIIISSSSGSSSSSSRRNVENIHSPSQQSARKKGRARWHIAKFNLITFTVEKSETYARCCAREHLWLCERVENQMKVGQISAACFKLCTIQNIIRILKILHLSLLQLPLCCYRDIKRKRLFGVWKTVNMRLYDENLVSIRRKHYAVKSIATSISLDNIF